MAKKRRPARRSKTRGRRAPAARRARTKKAPKARRAAVRSRTRPRAKPRPKPRKRAARPRSAVRSRAAANPKPRRPAAGRRNAPRTPPRARSAAPPALRIERTRRKLADVERLEPARDQPRDPMMAAARSGHDEMRAQLRHHTAASPKLTAGDIDADWQDAYAVGDEAPGGDNPTPDQDRVDDIGRALGVQYQDNQELQGGEEITERDQKRWELDPASSDDWPHKDKE